MRVDQEGAYVGRCAELCGTYHSMMNFELRAVPPEQFEQFLTNLQDGMSTPEALESIGQPPLASAATHWNVSSSIPGTAARSWMRLRCTVHPFSALSASTSTTTSTRVGANPAFESSLLTAIE